MAGLFSKICNRHLAELAACETLITSDSWQTGDLIDVIISCDTFGLNTAHFTPKISKNIVNLDQITLHQTEKALIARGIDSKTAADLRADGWTISNLKVATEATLKSAGLREEFIQKLFKEQRPPIPDDILSKLLFDNRFQCCVCRDPELPTIVHHIAEWAKSRSHSPENLAVLCLQHHSDAHSKKDLAQNLDAKTITGLKKSWELEVKRFDTEAILQAMRLEYSNWNYINELRVFEIAKELGIEFHKIRDFWKLVEDGVVEAEGLPVPVSNENLYYMYQGPSILHRYFYASEVLSQVISQLAIVNISDWLERGILRFALAPGDFVFVQGAHTFSPVTTNEKSGTGRGQICRGYRTANNVEVRFTFDRWEATSSSAKSLWLSGTKNQGSLIHVKDLSREEGKLIVSGTVLGICSNLGNLKTREYAVSLYESGHFRNPYAGYADDDGDRDDETEQV
jgi:hypothetical protein